MDIVIDDKEVQARLIKLEKDIHIEGKATLDQVGLRGKLLARYWAPGSEDSTGEVRRAIINRTVKNSKNYKEVQIGIVTDVHPEKRWHGLYFNLPLWMSISSRAKRHPWKNNKRPDFLKISRDILRKEYFRKVESFIGKIVLG